MVVVVVVGAGGLGVDGYDELGVAHIFASEEPTIVGGVCRVCV